MVLIYNLDCIPKGARLNYELTVGNCYAKKNGTCPLANATLQDIKNARQPNDCVRRNDRTLLFAYGKSNAK